VSASAPSAATAASAHRAANCPDDVKRVPRG
jgi:hypothetical protein